MACLKFSTEVKSSEVEGLKRYSPDDPGVFLTHLSGKVHLIDYIYRMVEEQAYLEGGIIHPNGSSP
jgi:hypothetical protein